MELGHTGKIHETFLGRLFQRDGCGADSSIPSALQLDHLDIFVGKDCRLLQHKINMQRKSPAHCITQVYISPILRYANILTKRKPQRIV